MPSFFEQLKRLESSGADIMVACRDENGLRAMADNFFREEIPYALDDGSGRQKGVTLKIASVSKGFFYPAEKLGVIGIND